jgi:hypothetical protein
MNLKNGPSFFDGERPAQIQYTLFGVYMGEFQRELCKWKKIVAETFIQTYFYCQLILL